MTEELEQAIASARRDLARARPAEREHREAVVELLEHSRALVQTSAQPISALSEESSCP